MSVYKLNRRHFLSIAAATGLSSFTNVTIVRANDDTDRSHWALLSDTHIPQDVEEAFRGFKPVNNLNQIVPQISQANVAGTVICGDVARLVGLPGDYQQLKTCLAPLGDHSLFMALGNHDDRVNFRAAFADSTSGESDADAGGKHVVVVEQKPVRFVILDSLFIVNEVAGLLGKAQREWLKTYLAESDDTPTVIFVHHTLGDNDGDLLDVPRFLDIVDPAKKIKAVFFGHSHVYSFQQRNGLHLINLPAVGYSFADEQPVGWIEAKFAATGVSLQLHAIASNTKHDGEVTELTWR
ncbi:MAG: metallophosphoesterase [Pirellulaceae bacterium]